MAGPNNLMQALMRFQDPNMPGFTAPGGFDVSGQTETPGIDPNAIDPIALAQEARMLQRKQGLAEAMMGQGYIPNSGPLGILPQVLGAVLGSKMQRQGDEKMSDLVGRYGKYRQQTDAVKFAQERQQEEEKAKRELAQIEARAAAEAKYRAPKEPGFDERLFNSLPQNLQGQAALGKFGLGPKEAPRNADLDAFAAYASWPPEKQAAYDRMHGRTPGGSDDPFPKISAALAAGDITPEQARTARRQETGAEPKQTPVTAEARNKLALLNNALANAKEYQKRVVRKDGSFADISSATDDTPQLLQSAVQDMLYAKSGASAPVEEVNKTVGFYAPSRVFGMPTELDSTATAKVGNFIRDLERMKATIEGGGTLDEKPNEASAGGVTITRIK